MERPALPALTGIRFFAAIHVVFFHYAPAMPTLAGNAASNGYLAVGLFFVLSGFVLAYNYAGRPVGVRGFWVARFARIYPAYLLAFVLAVPAVAMRLLSSEPRKFAAAGLAAGGLAQAWIPSLALAWNGPGWSLSNEAFFYLLFPAMLPALDRLSRRGLWIAAAASELAVLAPPAVQLAARGLADAEPVMYTPACHVGEFALGMAAALLYLRRRSDAHLLGPVSAALAAFAALSPGHVNSLLREPLAAPLFAVFIYSLACARGAAVSFLSSGPMRALGDASYAVYILQWPLMAWWAFAVRGGSRAGLDWPGFAAYVSMLIFASMACYRWVEKPTRRWILRRWNQQLTDIGPPTQAKGCKMIFKPYATPEFAAHPGRTLRSFRSEIRWPAAAEARSSVSEARD